MVTINDSISLDDSELKVSFIKASGPGGQNVNKVSTAVQLRFDINASESLSSTVKERLRSIAGSRLSDDGILIIEAKRFRTQDKNKTDAVNRLVRLIQQALDVPATRIPTKPGKTAKAARSASKKRRSETKRIRRYIPEDWE